MGHQQIPVAWQQLHEGRAGARAQDTLRGGAVQGRLQVLQLTPQLQQPGGRQGVRCQVRDTPALELSWLRALCLSVHLHPIPVQALVLGAPW